MALPGVREAGDRERTPLPKRPGAGGAPHRRKPPLLAVGVRPPPPAGSGAAAPSRTETFLPQRSSRGPAAASSSSPATGSIPPALPPAPLPPRPYPRPAGLAHRTAPRAGHPPLRRRLSLLRRRRRRQQNRAPRPAAPPSAAGSAEAAARPRTAPPRGTVRRQDPPPAAGSESRDPPPRRAAAARSGAVGEWRLGPRAGSFVLRSAGRDGSGGARRRNLPPQGLPGGRREGASSGVSGSTSPCPPDCERGKTPRLCGERSQPGGAAERGTERRVSPRCCGTGGRLGKPEHRRLRARREKEERTRGKPHPAGFAAGGAPVQRCGRAPARRCPSRCPEKEAVAEGLGTGPRALQQPCSGSQRHRCVGGSSSCVPSSKGPR